MTRFESLLLVPFALAACLGLPAAGAAISLFDNLDPGGTFPENVAFVIGGPHRLAFLRGLVPTQAVEIVSVEVPVQTDPGDRAAELTISLHREQVFFDFGASVLDTRTLLAPIDAALVTVSFPGIVLDAGVRYGVSVSTASGTLRWFGIDVGGTVNYSSSNDGPFAPNDSSMDPLLRVLAVPVPEPGTLPLVASGLGALILGRRGKLRAPRSPASAR